MSDTPSIYKSVLGLNETGGTFLAYSSISKYVRTATTLAPFKVATPIVSICSTHPFDVKIVGLAPSSISSTYRRISYSEWVIPGLFE